MTQTFDIFDSLDLKTARSCLGARTAMLDTGEHLFHEGERTRFFGLILSGAVNVVRYSRDGRAKVLSHLVRGEVFGTSFILGGEGRSFASVVATEPTRVLLLRGEKVLRPCATRCVAHVQLVCRLLETLAHRNTLLARKIDCLTQHTTAEKLLAYLEMRAEATGSDAFEIPFTRQQLADYLNVDRSALSTEIGKLVRNGQIETTRRHFRLLRPQALAPMTRAEARTW